MQLISVTWVWTSVGLSCQWSAALSKSLGRLKTPVSNETPVLHNESGRQSVEVQNHGVVLYLARVIIGDILIVGKFKTQYGYSVANNENVNVGPIRETDHNSEFLTVDPACTLLWIPYAAGRVFPNGVISGGHLADGSPTYVTKVTHDTVLSFGYYDTKSELAYYQMGSSHTIFTMELLILL